MCASDVINQFKAALDRITAVFLDAREGFELLQIRLEGDHSGTNWDASIHYANGQGPESTVVHCTTIGDRIGRNACDGENCSFISNMAIVAIYSFWEDHYRSALAAACGLSRSDVTADVFGDLRHLRNAIVHCNGTATREVQNARCLIWFNKADEIFMNQKMFIQLMSEVYDYLASVEAAL